MPWFKSLHGKDRDMILLHLGKSEKGMVSGGKY
jgi:hypothetical protein